MTTDLELESITRVRIEIHAALGGLIDSSALECLVPLVEWMGDEFARRPILADLLEVLISGGQGGAGYFDSRADFGHGRIYDDVPATRVLTVVVGTAVAVAQNSESLEIDTQAALLIWLVGEDAFDALLAVHGSRIAPVWRTVADTVTSPDLFVEICRTLVRAAVGSPPETCGELIKSTALSAAMRGLGYVVS